MIRGVVKGDTKSSNLNPKRYIYIFMSIYIYMRDCKRVIKGDRGVVQYQA